VALEEQPVLMVTQGEYQEEAVEVLEMETYM
jgi:hypothetical protein